MKIQVIKSTLEERHNNTSIQLTALTKQLIKTIDDLENKKITLNQAKVIDRLASNAIRAALGKAMIDQQILTVKDNGN